MTTQDHMAMHDEWNNRLSEYLDGEIDPAERAVVEAHLADCPACRADLAALRAVVARAQSLTDTPPASDLWTAIASRIEPRPARRTTLTTRRFAFTLPQLVAAGLALIVASGGMVWLARMGGPTMDFPPVLGEVRPVSFGDAAVDEAITDLQATLDAGRGRLDPQTVRVLESNLEAIDRAIAQCREALVADPSSVYLNTYLAETRRRKLELLRRATALVDSRS
jgi:predicted anti-sigma-YlaC factor YlaD